MITVWANHLMKLAAALVALFATISFTAETWAEGQYPGRWSSAEVEQRITALLAKMSLTDKLGQLTQQYPEGKFADDIREGKVGSFLGAHGAANTNRIQRIAVEQSPHGIPLIFANDVIHGYRTIFPIPLGEAASWDPQLVEKAARVAAAEARASGTHWTFAPMVDISRDARWGRIAEGAGEDPYLGAIMAAARVLGFQGTNLKASDSVLACAKHFAAYGGAEGGRDYNTVDISEQTLRDVYLPPFMAAVDAGVGTLMSAFNEISGVPASANHLILQRILREEWGFGGFVVSDSKSVTDMVAHGYAADNDDAAEKAIMAGVDMDMASFSYRSHLEESIRAGRIPIAIVDKAVRRVLRAKFALGLFDNPYADPQREQSVILSADNRTLARDVARHSIVLLKNEGNLLPIGKNVRKLAVIGPLADNSKDLLGTWAALGKPEDVVTVLQGIRHRAAERIEVGFSAGCQIESATPKGLKEAVQLAADSDLAIVVIGESATMSGEANSRSSLDLPPVQLSLLRAIHAAGVPVVAVVMSGRPLAIPWTADNIPAIVAAWHPGVEAGNAIADVLFGDFNPGGKLPVTFPRTVGQMPIYYAHKNTGRPATKERYTSKYIDIPWPPLYPFGYGLSYTTFEFADLKLSTNRIGPFGQLEVSVKVTNTGEHAGDEVVQLYVRDLVGSMTRPVRELKGFRRITLESGKSSEVRFMLNRDHLGFHNRHMTYTVEPGLFKVWVGPNSAEGLEAKFEVTSQ